MEGKNNQKKNSVIYFYSIKDIKYGCFSNFSNHSFILKGKKWLTSEHYFQVFFFL